MRTNSAFRMDSPASMKIALFLLVGCFDLVALANGEHEFEKQKFTTIEEAIKRWEIKTGQKASEAIDVRLNALIPPIKEMDASLSTLEHCEMLGLDTNMIDKISSLDGLKHLKILSLGGNNIKNLTGLEAVGDTLEQLWIPYNQIEKLDGISALKKLKVFYMSNNEVKDWEEFKKLKELPHLEDLLMVGNPLEEKHSIAGDWREMAIKELPRLKQLDGIPVIPEEEEDV